jgi:hypothetical protein
VELRRRQFFPLLSKWVKKGGIGCSGCGAINDISPVLQLNRNFSKVIKEIKETLNNQTTLMLVLYSATNGTTTSPY